MNSHDHFDVGFPEIIAVTKMGRPSEFLHPLVVTGSQLQFQVPITPSLDMLSHPKSQVKHSCIERRGNVGLELKKARSCCGIVEVERGDRAMPI
jgi:hypothetical protein